MVSGSDVLALMGRDAVLAWAFAGAREETAGEVLGVEEGPKGDAIVLGLPRYTDLVVGYRPVNYPVCCIGSEERESYRNHLRREGLMLRPVNELLVAGKTVSHRWLICNTEKRRVEFRVHLKRVEWLQALEDVK